jgi:hypothetical protein
MMLSLQRMARRRGATPRSPYLHALLALTLLVAQLGAFTHALSHFAAPDAGRFAAAISASPAYSPDGAPQQSSGGSGSTHQGDTLCALCSAFAGASAALVDCHFSYSAERVTPLPPERSARRVAASPFLSFSSRAPPPAFAVV